MKRMSVFSTLNRLRYVRLRLYIIKVFFLHDHQNILLKNRFRNDLIAKNI